MALHSQDLSGLAWHFYEVLDLPFELKYFESSQSYFHVTFHRMVMAGSNSNMCEEEHLECTYMLYINGFEVSKVYKAGHDIYAGHRDV